MPSVPIRFDAGVYSSVSVFDHLGPIFYSEQIPTNASPSNRVVMVRLRIFADYDGKVMGKESGIEKVSSGGGLEARLPVSSRDKFPL